MGYKQLDHAGDNHTESLMKFCQQHKSIVLYGAGNNGRYVKVYLDYLGEEVQYYVDRSLNVRKWLGDNKIISPEKIKGYKGGVIITSERFADEIMSTLSIYGIERENVYVLRGNEIQHWYDHDQDWVKYSINQYTIPLFEEIFKSRDIDIDNPVIEIGNFKILNPLYQDACYQMCFFGVWLDLLLPPVLEEYNKLMEGPVEYGNVHVNPGDVVFDCGANIGVFSCVSASRGAEVHAFEPVPSIFSYLLLNAKLYNNILPVMSAVGNHDSEVQLASPALATTSCSIVLDAGQHTVNAHAETLDGYIDKQRINRCDFIKADIEGAERMMLAGAKNVLKYLQPRLSICTYHLPDDSDVLESLIKEANSCYVIEHKWNKLYAYVPQ